MIRKGDKVLLPSLPLKDGRIIDRLKIGMKGEVLAVRNLDGKTPQVLIKWKGKEWPVSHDISDIKKED